MRGLVYGPVSLFSALLSVYTPCGVGQTEITREQVTFMSGSLRLAGKLWKPIGQGPFPAVLFNHGSGKDELQFVSPVAQQFVSRGYLFFAPYRRGHGESSSAGPYIRDMVAAEEARKGKDAARQLTVQLLETDHFIDQMAALEYLKGRTDVDNTTVVITGISFGGVQAMLAAEKAKGIRAVINFAGAAMAWAGNGFMRSRLLASAGQAKVPVLFIQAGNDFNTAPSQELCATMLRAGKQCRVRHLPSVWDDSDGRTFIRL